MSKTDKLLREKKIMNEYDFLSPFYPLPCEKEDEPIHFYFTPLNILTEKEFDSLLKIEDYGSVPTCEKENRDLRFKIFKSIFVKNDVSVFEEKLLTYSTGTQTKLNKFNYITFTKPRDKKYKKGLKSINFLTGITLSESGKEVIIRNLSLDSLLKQIKDKTLIGKVYASSRYDHYLETLREQYKTNPNKIIPLQVGKIIPETFAITNVNQLVEYLIPGCKAHKIGDFINTLKTSIGVKEFKKSKNYGRIFELRGEAIRYFYNEKNYSQLNADRSSVLFNSCMRHNENFEQLKFYSNNPETIALLVVMDKDNPRQIVARTVLWTTVDGLKVTDRVYYNRQDDLNTLITYCKSAGYGSIHRSTSDSYGLTRQDNAVVHIENNEDTGLPYFDTMRVWERINSFLARSSTELKTYCIRKGLDYSFRDQGDYYENERNEFSIKGNSKREYIYDVNGEQIKDKNKIIAIDLPRLGYLSNDQVEIIGYPKRKTLRISSKFMTSLKTKYNCIESALCRFGPEKYTEYLDDKQNLVYSVILKTYIDKRDSYYNYNLHSYIYNESSNDPIIRGKYKLKKLKSIYSNKIFSVTQEGYEYLRKLNENFIVPFNIVRVRPSRKFRIRSVNVSLTGVSLQNINIPFKYLKTIKCNG